MDGQEPTGTYICTVCTELTIEWVLTRPLGKLEVGIDNDKQTGQLSTIFCPCMHAEVNKK